ncbi:MAG TPA: TRAM domain-containing protein, partial [Bacteroidia bacterium]|nr:TRAM domain-containing protein [Bacteroidia bacterium]
MKSIQNLLITDIADEGRAVGKFNDLVVFVEKAVPGDVVNVHVFKKNKNFAEAFITEMVQPSAHRIEPFCEHFGICGGCKWQYLTYEQQLFFKQQQVTETLKRLAYISDVPTQNIIASAQTKYYRNKLEFTFSKVKWLTNEERANQESDKVPALGFHIKGRFDKILNIDKCYLQDDLSNQIRNFVREFCIKHNYPFFDLKRQVGLMRNLIIRNSSLGQWMVSVIFSEDVETNRNDLLEALHQKFSQITCLMY